jgi:Ca2+/Na+ antiporter
LNLTVGASELYTSVGLAIALIFISYYGLYFYYIYKFIKEIQTQVRNNKEEELTSKNQPKRLREVINLEEIPHSALLKFHFEELRYTKQTHIYWSPLLTNARGMLLYISIQLMLLSGSRPGLWS